MENICELFPTWEAYCKAFTASLDSFYAISDFPEYAEICEQHNFADLLIIQNLLDAGYDPQEGLESFVYACLGGPRHIRDLADCGMIHIAFEKFIQKGAETSKLELRRLFTPDFFNIEDEENVVHARGVIIDELAHFGIDPNLYGDWDSVTAQHWDDVPEDFLFFEKFQKALKYSSKYLNNSMENE
jgi:hypothetical protein